MTARAASPRRADGAPGPTAGVAVAGPGQVAGGVGSESSGLDAATIAAALELPPPTPEQRRVIEHPPTSMLVVAGAGSGKTETMAGRVVWLVANGHVAPEHVLGLTFTRKAAGELAERIDRRLRLLADTGLWSPAADPADGPPAAPREGGVRASGGAPGPGATPTVSTYHAYAGRLLRDHGLRVGIEGDARLLTPAAAWQLAHEAVTTYDGPIDLDAAESTITQAVLALSSELAEHLRALPEIDSWLQRFVDTVEALPLGGRRRAVPAQVAELLAHGRRQRAMMPLLARYTELKRSRDCLDFADQVALAARLAVTSPEVVVAERARHRVVLLDEFQDTSEAQLQLLQALFAEPGPTAAVPVMAVGDPHQSIYGWRGASATTLAAFTRRFGTPRDEVSTLPLSTSWRNDAAILAAANRIAAPLTDGTPVDVARLVPAPGAGTGRVEALRAHTHLDEAEAVADWVARRWWREPGLHSGVSAAVLCRRRAQFPALVDALRARDLPVEVVGVGGLLLTPEIGDLHALLAVASDPGRGDMLMRLLTGPAVRLGAADLDGLGAWTREQHRREQRRLGGPDVVASDPRASDPRASDPRASDRASDPRASDSGISDSGISDSSAPDTKAVNTSATDEPAAATTYPGAPPGAPPPDAAARPVGEVHDAPSIIAAVHQLPPEHWRGPAGEWLSSPARTRLRQLARAIAQVRRSVDQPLGDIVRAAEEALGLDVEVLARPGATWASGRVHLDAFAGVAREFEHAADRPGLDGFLAWLDVARTQERGLDTPTVATSQECVQVLTVHASKGLEWDVVAVPGLLEGSFPGYRFGRSAPSDRQWRLPPPKDRGWLTGLDRIPYELRGDAAALPTLPWRCAASMDELAARVDDFAQAGGGHALEEERRLAYVALTRARHEVLLSASVWAEAGSPRVTSRFVTELVAPVAGAAIPGETPEEVPGQVHVGEWRPMPPTDGSVVANPLEDCAPSASWPVSLVGAERRARHEADAALVRVLRGSQDDPRHLASPAPQPVGTPTSTDSGGTDSTSAATPEHRPATADEETLALLRDADLLLELAHLDDLAGRGQTDDHAGIMPGHLSTSDLVRYAEDPVGFVADERRPVPRPPSPGRRAGTELHRWIEQHFGRSAMVELDDLPGSADDMLSPDLDSAKARFLASEWASRAPLAVELPVETVIDGVPVRGRIDAVFSAPGGVVIVDWKASRPASGDRLRARTLQLSAYRVAYSRLAGMPIDQVAGAFYHAATGQTVYPPQPADPEGELRAYLGSLRSGGAEPGSPPASPTDSAAGRAGGSAGPASSRSSVEGGR